MNPLCLFVDSELISKRVSDIIKSATSSIFIATPSLDFDVFLPLLSSSPDIINNIEINILVAQDGLLKMPKLPRKCIVKIVENIGPRIKDELAFWTSTAEQILDQSEMKEVDDLKKNLDKFVYKFNQSFILVDNSVLIIGSGMFLPKNRERQDLILIGTANEDFIRFAQLNWKNGGTISQQEWSQITTRAEDILGPQGYEHDLICGLIKEAKQYIYIETSTFLSHQATQNRVAKHLVDRLIQINTNGWEQDPFRCVILLNSSSSLVTATTTATLFESAEYIAEKINYTLEFISEEIAKTGLNPAMFIDRIFIGCLEQKTLTNLILIQDGKKCIVSSSSLCDRSLAKQNIELGIMISENSEQQINDIQNMLWCRRAGIKHMSSKQQVINFADFFTACLNGSGGVKKFKSWSSLTDKSLIKSFKIEDLIFKYLIGACYYT